MADESSASQLTPSCDRCTHAAFNDAGVYCTALNDAIFDEKVAIECGMYDEKEVLRPPSANGNGKLPIGRMTLGDVEIRDAAVVHLRTRYSSTFGRVFSIGRNEEDVQEAADWLSREVTGVLRAAQARAAAKRGAA